MICLKPVEEQLEHFRNHKEENGERVITSLNLLDSNIGDNNKKFYGLIICPTKSKSFVSWQTQIVQILRLGWHRSY